MSLMAQREWLAARRGAEAGVLYLLERRAWAKGDPWTAWFLQAQAAAASPTRSGIFGGVQ